MKNKRSPLRLASTLVAWMGSVVIAAADEVTFANPATRLVGSVQAIEPDGGVALLTPHAPEPLQLAPGAVTRIAFAATAPTNSPAAAPAGLTLLQLQNGDRLTAVVRSLDAERLVIHSPDAGELTIPRQQLRALWPDGGKPAVCYAGPNDDGWQHSEHHPSKWGLHSGEFLVSGNAEVTKSLPTLPQAFTLRFRLGWDQQPNFQLHFADPLLPVGQAADRYLFRLTPAGIDLKRECSSGRRYRDVAVLNRLPASFQENAVQVEIRVDRETQKMEILLNGESEGLFADPAAPLPAGNGLRLISNISGSESMTFSRLEVLAGKGGKSGEMRLPEQAEMDILTTVEDEQWRGKCSAIRLGTSGWEVVFQAESAANSIEIPLQQVAALVLAHQKQATQTESAADPAKTALIRLVLDGGTELTATACRFDGQSLTTQHPLLGALSVAKSRLACIEFQPQPPP